MSQFDPRNPGIFTRALLLAILCPAMAPTPLAQTSGAPSLEELRIVERRVQRALPQAQRATVVVGGGGSGVIVSADGLVLSAEHVTGRPGRRVVLTLHDGDRVGAVTLGSSRFADAGMLRITDEGRWPFAPLAEADASRVGDWCFALGHPEGYDEARGPVLRVGRVIVKGRNVIRTDCQLIGGDSGGPLFNLAGEVIGIHSRVSDDLDANFHAPVEAYQRHWDLLLAGESIPRQNGRGGGYLGVRTSPQSGGLVIEDVFPGSAAAEASLEPGWIIIGIDDYEVASPEEFGLAIRAKQPGDKIRIRYRQDQTERSLELTLGERPRRRRDG